MANQNPTVSDIIARIKLMGAEISGIADTFNEWPDGPFTTLPAFGVRAFNATYRRQGNAHMIQERNYDLVLVVSNMKDDPFPDATAIAAVEPFLLSVPQYFMKHRLLSTTNDAPLNGVIQTEFTEDRYGPAGINNPHRHGSAQHWGAVFNLVVTTKHLITS